jgi:SAM-dependent methyltransferase
MDDPRESSRLVAKVDSAAWVNRFLQPVIDRQSVAKVLDVGCGPGEIANAVADANPNLRLTGVDASAARIAEALAHDRVELINGDACDLPLEDESFDVVYCRFLLEYLPDKEQAVAELVRVTKPGGFILLQDLDGQLVWNYPLSPERETIIDQSLTALAKTGFDPMVGRKLFHLLGQTDMHDVSVNIEPYHQIIGAIQEPERTQWELKLDIARSALSKMVSPDFAGEAYKTFMAHLDSPHTITYSNLFTVVGRKS